MKIKTITDVITNSSSEVFLVKVEKGYDIKELLSLVEDDGFSGMGGSIEVHNISPSLALVDFDRAKKKLMSFMIDSGMVVDIFDGRRVKRDSTTNRIISYGEDDCNEVSGDLCDKIYYNLKQLREYKEVLEDLSWKSGLKLVMDLVDKYNELSEYNLDISPLSNVEKWIEEASIISEALQKELD